MRRDHKVLHRFGDFQQYLDSLPGLIPGQDPGRHEAEDIAAAAPGNHGEAPAQHPHDDGRIDREGLSGDIDFTPGQSVSAQAPLPAMNTVSRVIPRLPDSRGDSLRRMRGLAVGTIGVHRSRLTPCICRNRKGAQAVPPVRSTGRVTVKPAPWPGALRTEMLPAWNSTMRLAMARPRPLPWGLPRPGGETWVNC